MKHGKFLAAALMALGVTAAAMAMGWADSAQGASTTGADGVVVSKKASPGEGAKSKLDHVAAARRELPRPSTSSSRPPAEVMRALARFKQLGGAMSSKFVVPASWHPPTTTVSSGRKTPMPKLDAKLAPSGQLEQAMRWFDSLPDPVPEPESSKRARKKRMAAAGLEVDRRECRSRVCLLAFRYSEASSKRLRRRIGKTGAVHARDSWLSITTVGADGRVEGHVFMRQADGARR